MSLSPFVRFCASMEKTRHRDVQSLGNMMKKKDSKHGDKKKNALRDSIITRTLTHVSETWMWNESQRSNIPYHRRLNKLCERLLWFEKNGW